MNESVRSKVDLKQRLRSWRDEIARTEGVEGYRVISNATIDALVEALPSTKDELCAIKGIKDVKYRKYGKSLLGLIAESGLAGKAAHVEAISFLPTESETSTLETTGPAEPLSVSSFLDGLNIELSGMAARIRGEVTSLDIRERVVYFTLKDAEDESVLSCLIFRYQYQVSGVDLRIGDEIVVEGFPDIYKPSGRLSLKVGIIEYAGVGELKKAYDALYRKLETSGVFAPEKKRVLPQFAESIALITSQDGAAIGDFTMNLGRSGMHVDFYPTLVEGKKAVFDIIQAIRFFNRSPERYNCLVIIRGGGSLESLQAFNTEALVNEIALSKIPVLAGIGHERDVSLAALASDAMVSTPTAAARLLGTPWEEARATMERLQTELFTVSENVLRRVREGLRVSEERLRETLTQVSEKVSLAERNFRERAALFPSYILALRDKLRSSGETVVRSFSQMRDASRDSLRTAEKLLQQYDPERVLSLGYSLVRQSGRLLRSAEGLHVGDRIDIQLGTGRVESEIKAIKGVTE